MDLTVVTRALASLNLRRKNLNENDKGFTLIELLVVVIIIGILAAIAIPVYLGIQDNAKDSATKSDMTTWKTSVIAAETNANGVLPLTAVAAGIVATTGSTAPHYVPTAATATAPATFCIDATSASGKIFRLTDATQPAVGAVC